MECQIAYLKHRMDMVKKELLVEHIEVANHNDFNGDESVEESGRELWRKFCEKISTGEEGTKEISQKQVDDREHKKVQRQQQQNQQKQSKKQSLLDSVLEKGDAVASTKTHRRISSWASASNDNEGFVRNSFLSKQNRDWGDL